VQVLALDQHRNILVEFKLLLTLQFQFLQVFISLNLARLGVLAFTLKEHPHQHVILCSLTFSEFELYQGYHLQLKDFADF